MDRSRADVGYRYCPQCRAEYRPGFELCADCGVDLVHELPAEPGVELDDHPGLGPNPVAVFSSGRDTDAEIVRSLLAGCGIGAEVWSSGMGAYMGRSGPAIGGHRVMVGADDEEIALQIIAAEPEADQPAE